MRFDAATARQVVGDAHARRIEAKARVDADTEVFAPPSTDFGETYWGQVQAEMCHVLYRTQYMNRLARNERRCGLLSP